LINGQEQARTPVIAKSVNPMWNLSMPIEVASPHDVITFEVYDHDENVDQDIDNDDFMGYVSMNIRDLIDVDYHDGLQQEHSFDVSLLSHTNGNDAEQNANDDMGTIQLKMTLNILHHRTWSFSDLTAFVSSRTTEILIPTELTRFQDKVANLSAAIRAILEAEEALDKTDQNATQVNVSLVTSGANLGPLGGARTEAANEIEASGAVMSSFKVFLTPVRVIHHHKVEPKVVPKAEPVAEPVADTAIEEVDDRSEARKYAEAIFQLLDRNHNGEIEKKQFRHDIHKFDKEPSVMKMYALAGFGKRTPVKEDLKALFREIDHGNTVNDATYNKDHQSLHLTMNELIVWFEMKLKTSENKEGATKSDKNSKGTRIRTGSGLRVLDRKTKQGGKPPKKQATAKSAIPKHKQLLGV
jgi:hypothetical protein